MGLICLRVRANATRSLQFPKSHIYVFAMKKLFLVYCGFYDHEVFEGVYESHVNFFVVAQDMSEARLAAKKNNVFKAKHMHVDGLQEIVAVDGHKINLLEDASLSGETVVIS